MHCLNFFYAFEPTHDFYRYFGKLHCKCISKQKKRLTLNSFSCTSHKSTFVRYIIQFQTPKQFRDAHVLFLFVNTVKVSYFKH